MIYEALPLRVDIDRLREYFHRVVEPLPPMMQSKAFGGWSILSHSGSYRDGWQTGHLCFKTHEDGTPYFDHELAEKLGVRSETAHCNPTEVCTSYMGEIIEEIRQMGLEPCRARWSLLRAGGQSSLHRDAGDEKYAVRAHIPVITNAGCSFHSNGEVEIVPADGRSYVVAVNRMHQVFNLGDQDRVHVIMNVTDRNGVTKFHRFS